MKKVLYAILITAFIMPVMMSCKKGPNDPALSLKSRNARITAKWKLTKIDGTTQDVYMDEAYTGTVRFDGSTFTYTSSQSGSEPFTATGSFEMTIDKDGIVNFTSSFTPSDPDLGDPNVCTGTGHWYWQGNDNSKVAISLDISVSGSSLFDGGNYNIDQLKSKELILKVEYSQIVNGKTYSDNYTYTFTAQ